MSVENITEFGGLMGVFMVLVAFTNVTVQVLKGFTYDKIPTRVLAAVIGVLAAVAAMAVYCAATSIPITWYYAVGSIAGGIGVAYCAMYGYDTLYNELWGAVKKLLGGGKNGSEN